jgi:NADH-quinone oxidoreductase subunit C
MTDEPTPPAEQEDGSSTGSDSGTSGDRTAGGQPIHHESDEKAPVKGATPEGESEPQEGTKPETLTGSAPAVSSAAEEADVSAAADSAEGQLAEMSATTEVLEVRKGMFGVQGTGDTSGYGGLNRTIEFPAPSNPPFGGWWDSVYDRMGRLMSDGDDPVGHPKKDLMPNFGEVITKVVIHRGEITFHVAREHLVALVKHLRDDALLRFEFCSSVSGVNYPADEDRELHAVYHLQSMTYNRRIRLEVSVPDADPHIPSVVATYPTADWHERETYDMFGIIFDGHPALTRILMPDDWPGHPQRKDYPLGGIPVEYKGATIPPPEQRRSYN